MLEETTSALMIGDHELLNLEIRFASPITDGSLNLGYLTLTDNKGLTCIVDTPIVRYSTEGGGSTITIELEFEFLVSEKFNMFNFTAELWVEEDFEEEPEAVTLHTRYKGLTQAHDVTCV